MANDRRDEPDSASRWPPPARSCRPRAAVACWGGSTPRTTSGIFHLPLRHFYAHCLKSGDDFAWFPGIYCGFPLHGEGQVGMYHPLHLLLYSALPFGLGLQPRIPGELPGVAGAACSSFLRRWALPRDAALFGAIVFAFGGYNAGHYFHMNSVAILAHLPWLLAAIDVDHAGPMTRGAPPGRGWRWPC